MELDVKHTFRTGVLAILPQCFDMPFPYWNPFKELAFLRFSMPLASVTAPPKTTSVVSNDTSWSSGIPVTSKNASASTASFLKIPILKYYFVAELKCIEGHVPCGQLLPSPVLPATIRATSPASRNLSNARKASFSVIALTQTWPSLNLIVLNNGAGMLALWSFSQIFRRMSWKPRKLFTCSGIRNWNLNNCDINKQVFCVPQCHNIFVSTPLAHPLQRIWRHPEWVGSQCSDKYFHQNYFQFLWPSNLAWTREGYINLILIRSFGARWKQKVFKLNFKAWKTTGIYLVIVITIPGEQKPHYNYNIQQSPLLPYFQNFQKHIIFKKVLDSKPEFLHAWPIVLEQHCIQCACSPSFRLWIYPSHHKKIMG